MAFENPIASFVATDSEYADQLLAHDSDSIRSIKVTLTSGQNLKRGTLVGEVTGSPAKYIASLKGASDGSQGPGFLAIVAQDCDATSADKQCLVYTQGTFNGHKVILGAGWTVANAYETLRTLGIILEMNPVVAP
jgi:Bacteriophage lambda head decoration protein D